MRILLAIDDTDDLESIGTGALLENLCEELNKKDLGVCNFVTRHQLLIHDDIAYTSHNSAMCCELQMEKDDLEAIICLCQKYLVENRAEGSDPGLCVVCFKKIDDYTELISFGQAAKERVLKKADAYDLASKYPETVFLSEHGGTGDGVIGALAGCGLRLSGMDGKIKRKIRPENPEVVMTIGEFREKYGMAYALDEEFNEISDDDFIKCGKSIKAFLWNDKHAVVLTPDGEEQGRWRSISKKKDAS